MADNFGIDPGGFIHRIAIQARSSSADAFGQQAATWATVLQTWAKFRALSLQELYSAGQLSSRVTHEIVMRFPVAAVSAGMRVSFNGRTYTIQAVNNIEERGVYLKLLVLADHA
jgi:SPP1 family predicted phage head-tail adaptor